MFEQVGHHVEKIKRVRYGSLNLDVESGKFRHLTQREAEALKTSTQSSRTRGKKTHKPAES
jgi:23S rRNA pseudouridine2605 synthase